MVDRPPSRIESFKAGPVGISGREYVATFCDISVTDDDMPLLSVEKRDRFVRKQRMPKRFRR